MPADTAKAIPKETVNATKVAEAEEPKKEEPKKEEPKKDTKDIAAKADAKNATKVDSKNATKTEKKPSKEEILAAALGEASKTAKTTTKGVPRGLPRVTPRGRPKMHWLMPWRTSAEKCPDEGPAGTAQPRMVRARANPQVLWMSTMRRKWSRLFGRIGDFPDFPMWSWRPRWNCA